MGDASKPYASPSHGNRLLKDSCKSLTSSGLTSFHHVGAGLRFTPGGLTEAVAAPVFLHHRSYESVLFGTMMLQRHILEQPGRQKKSRMNILGQIIGHLLQWHKDVQESIHSSESKTLNQDTKVDLPHSLMMDSESSAAGRRSHRPGSK